MKLEQKNICAIALFCALDFLLDKKKSPSRGLGDLLGPVIWSAGAPAQRYTFFVRRNDWVRRTREVAAVRFFLADGVGTTGAVFFCLDS